MLLPTQRKQQQMMNGYDRVRFLETEYGQVPHHQENPRWKKLVKPLRKPKVSVLMKLMGLV
jgi:hypothetical protein